MTENVGIYLRDGFGMVSEQEVSDSIRSLPEWRREQALSYKSLSGQWNCAASYHLLCRALKEKYGITTQPTFLTGEHGKPLLAEFPDIHFNLSHCSHAIACAVGDRPVGIDVESTDRHISSSLLRYTMNDREQEEIANDPKAFFRLWTRKEALVKMQGTGLQSNIPDILSDVNLMGVTISTEDHSDKGYILSVAYKNP